MKNYRETDPEFAERVEHFAFDEVVQSGQLDDRTRFMAILATLLGCQGVDAFRAMLPAALNFGVQAGLFALIALFVSTKTMDSVIKGFNTAMQFLIISPNQEEIVRRIHTEMDRGCTRLEATGTYEGRKNGALLCVVPRMEASRLKKIVSECDAHAFVTVCDVHEALGEGFSYRHIS